MFFLPVLVTSLGTFLLFKLKMFPFRHPIRTISGCVSSVNDGGGFSAFALALAGTLGVGNIFGVAISIIVGGAGSVFWLLISSIFSSVIKYAEALVSVDNIKLSSDGARGGMMYVIEEKIKNGKFFASLYAIACLILALVMGAAMQSSAAVGAAIQIIDVPKSAISASFVLLTLIFIVGNRVKIKKITAVLIPTASFLYIFLSLCIIFRYFSEIPRVISEIFKSAFSFEAFGGGVLGAFLKSPVINGYSTGILSNEAGAGTSAMAHSSNKNATPVKAGLAGMGEVFMDTTVLCMLTAFAILLPLHKEPTKSGVELVINSISSAFPYAEWILFFSIFAFALATVVCWYYYTGVLADYLFGRRGEGFFSFLYFFTVFLGAYFDSAVFASLADVVLLVLSFLVAPVIIKSSDRIKALSEQYGLIK